MFGLDAAKCKVYDIRCFHFGLKSLFCHMILYNLPGSCSLQFVIWQNDFSSQMSSFELSASWIVFSTNDLKQNSVIKCYFKIYFMRCIYIIRLKPWQPKDFHLKVLVISRFQRLRVVCLWRCLIWIEIKIWVGHWISSWQPFLIWLFVVFSHTVYDVLIPVCTSRWFFFVLYPGTLLSCP